MAMMMVVVVAVIWTVCVFCACNHNVWTGVWINRMHCFVSRCRRFQYKRKRKNKSTQFTIHSISIRRNICSFCFVQFWVERLCEIPTCSTWSLWFYENVFGSNGSFSISFLSILTFSSSLVHILNNYLFAVYFIFFFFICFSLIFH